MATGDYPQDNLRAYPPVLFPVHKKCEEKYYKELNKRLKKVKKLLARISKLTRITGETK